MICPKEHGRAKVGTEAFSYWAVKKSAVSWLSNSLSEHRPWAQPSDQPGRAVLAAGALNSQCQHRVRLSARGWARHPRLWELQGGPASCSRKTQLGGALEVWRQVPKQPSRAAQGAGAHGTGTARPLRHSPACRGPAAGHRPPTLSRLSNSALCPGPASRSCRTTHFGSCLFQRRPKALSSPNLPPQLLVSTFGHRRETDTSACHSDRDGPESGRFFS